MEFNGREPEKNFMTQFHKRRENLLNSVNSNRCKDLKKNRDVSVWINK